MSFAKQLIDSFIRKLFCELKKYTKGEEAWNLLTTVVSKMCKRLTIVIKGAANAKYHSSKTDHITEFIWTI